MSMLLTLISLFTISTRDDYKFDEWEAWNAFGEGSSVTFDMEAGGTKMTMTTTLVKKTADEITVSTKMKMGDNDMPANERKIKKPSGKAGDADCPACKKPMKDHKDEGKWSDETVKVGDQDLKCRVYESAEKSCTGQAIPKTKMWFCKDVPGNIVKMDNPYSKMNLSKFEKK